MKQVSPWYLLAFDILSINPLSWYGCRDEAQGTHMNILIIGQGGREHAMAWSIKRCAKTAVIYVAPGNAGTDQETGVENVPIASNDIPELIKFAKQNNIDLTIVGPEAPLAAGIVDAFAAENLACFGPSQEAAQLESSKAFSKQFMLRHNIPTACYAAFTDLAQAKAYAEQQAFPLVIKADGLATGKGVVIAHNLAEAFTALEQMLQGYYGSAGQCVIIEEFLSGEEASFIVMSDGEFALALATSQDHKTRDDGDQGPNTGGMGAYSPAPIITPEIHQQVMDQIIYPTLKGMAAEGHPYVGFLYAGLMIAKGGREDLQVKVLEFNCRLGDPETQAILFRLQSNLAEACAAALEKRLNQVQLSWDPRAALGIVLAAKGYPEQYPRDEVIQGLELEREDCKIFHAGTVLEDSQIKTAGGRVLCATALGSNLREAQALAYELAKNIQWPSKYYRTDIGYRGILRDSSSLQDAGTQITRT